MQLAKTNNNYGSAEDQTLGASFVKVCRLCHLMLHLWLRPIAEQQRTQHSKKNNSTIPHSDSDETKWTWSRANLEWSGLSCSLLLCSPCRFLSSRRSACNALQSAVTPQHTTGCMMCSHQTIQRCFFQHAWVTYLSHWSAAVIMLQWQTEVTD